MYVAIDILFFYNSMYVANMNKLKLTSISFPPNFSLFVISMEISTAR